MIVYCKNEYLTFSEINLTYLLGLYYYWYRASRLTRKKSKDDKQTLEELNLAHRRSQAKFQLLQTSYIKRIKLFLFCHIINILLTELSRSAWKNLDLGRVYRPHWGGHWDFRFCAFGYFFDRFIGFWVKKTSVFRFWCSMRFAEFSFFSIWFSVLVKNISGFSVLVPNVVFGFCYLFFPIWTYLGYSFVCGFRFWPILFAVLRFWMNFSLVLRFLVYPNAPLTQGGTLEAIRPKPLGWNDITKMQPDAGCCSKL